jgi:deoxyhypusine synthase
MEKTIEDAKRSILKKSEDVEGLAVRGYDFNDGLDLKRLLDAYKSSAFQAHNLGKAIEIAKKMRKEGTRIFLGYTSNMVSSGNREVIRYLVQHRLVDVLVTTAGGIEEDFIKTKKPFIMGRFDADGAEMRKKGINRTGNIFVPNSRYIWFEEFFQPILRDLWERQKAEGKAFSPSDIIAEMGKRIGDESSIYYWAQKNGIPVFCPPFMDGATGDNFYFFNFDKQDSPLRVDQWEDHHRLIELVMKSEETGMILLGGGVVKHTICNANMMREGAKYAVYINTGEEFDGSDSGARPEEAKSWGKISAGAEDVKVHGDATIIFPLLVAGAFVDEKE